MFATMFIKYMLLQYNIIQHGTNFWDTDTQQKAIVAKICRAYFASNGTPVYVLPKVKYSIKNLLDG